MPFLPPNQQRQSIEGTIKDKVNNAKNFQLLFLVIFGKVHVCVDVFGLP